MSGLSSPPPPTRRFSPTPVETTVRSTRRFAPEPVETTSRSNRKDETSRVEENGSDKKEFATKRRFVPEPVETIVRSSRGRPSPVVENTPMLIAPRPVVPEISEPLRRRFTPDLIETTRRSKRAGDSKPATLPTDKTDLTPGIPNIYTSSKRKANPAPDAANVSRNTSSSSINTIAPIPPRRQPSMRPHPNTRRSTRQDSFQPELDAIPSDDNTTSDEGSDGGKDGDSTPSLTESLESSEDSLMRLQLARTRESCDDRFSGYLLALAAKAAEKQLQEQALAAFPNETFHEIVEHFYDREIDVPSDEESVEGIGLLINDTKIKPLRRQSTEVGWAAKEMQAHQETLNRLREDETNAKIAAEATKPTFQDPFWTNGMTVKSAAVARAYDGRPEPEKEAELDRMRSAASPPMLGGDLKFRMCPSPKPTKFESDQRHNCQPPSKAEDGGGLWGGYCVADEVGEMRNPRINGPAMLQTPHPELEDDPDSADNAPGCPKSIGSNAGVRMLAGIDERLQAEVARAKAEEALLEEFDHVFVTQVYNYLSLGYPSLARQYDEELAKITRVPEEELRKEDHLRKAAGHLGVPEKKGANGNVNVNGDGKEAREDGEGDGDGMTYCARWKALKIYILEWARQHPGMEGGAASPSAWGVRARRGSWAI